MIFEMGILSTKRVGFLLTLFWLGMLCYIMLPNHIPDFLNLRSKSSKNEPASQVDSGLLRLQPGKASQNDSEVIPVVIASDNKNLGGLVALINSIVSHTKSPVKFYLAIDKKSEEQLTLWLMTTKLKSIKSVIKVFPEEWVEGKIKVRGGRQELGSPLNFARYYIPRLFPEIKEKVIYLDNDCIVQGDIRELYNTRLAHKHLAAFSEDCRGMNKRLSRLSNVYAEFLDFKNVHVQKMKMKPTACSFNTGVFVANMSEWKKQNVTSQLEYWMKLNTEEEVYGNEKGGGSSQPPMMIVFYEKYSTIDPLWHVRYLGWSAGTSYSKPFIQKARLLHWNGQFKPWGRIGQHQEVWSKYFIPDPTNQFKPIRRNA